MIKRTPYEPGTFCWVGLATSDPEAATGFYAALFDWQSDDLAGGDAGTYTVLRYRSEDVAMLYRQTAAARAAGAPPHWTSYISVEDVDATAAQAGELGGAAVFRGPFDVVDAGRVVAVRDPLGAIVSLWQPRSRVGATLIEEVGALCWTELATSDVERAKSFYYDLFGWEYGTGRGGQATIEAGGRPIGNIRGQTPQERGEAPGWLPYFMVEDAEIAAREAERLGGRRVAGDHSGRSVAIADRQGAEFAVREVGRRPK
jgi:predicted enzyme related to lactoylglutathione lyase